MTAHQMAWEKCGHSWCTAHTHSRCQSQLACHRMDITGQHGVGGCARAEGQLADGHLVGQQVAGALGDLRPPLYLRSQRGCIVGQLSAPATESCLGKSVTTGLLMLLPVRHLSGLLAAIEKAAFKGRLSKMPFSKIRHEFRGCTPERMSAWTARWLPDCQQVQLAWLASSVACSVSKVRCSCGRAGFSAFATACTASDQPATVLPLAAGCASAVLVDGLDSADILQCAVGSSADAAWAYTLQPGLLLVMCVTLSSCLSTADQRGS